jgi:tetratricopeptide (TPR) repeat protein
LLVCGCKSLGTGAAGPYADVGGFHREISTASPVAQTWFDRGLALTYGFNHEEAIRCFEKAAEADPGCPMPWWGIAYCWGPNINNMDMDANASRAAWEACQKATAALSTRTVTDVERQLVEALSQRYAWPAPADRGSLNKAYAATMRSVYREHSKDPDVVALFAESLMDLRPWKLWSRDGKPAPETPEIVATIEHGLALDAHHPGLCHFYIHTMEASPTPEKALPYADNLRRRVPGAGHLVHMPSHIDVLVGQYEEAIIANCLAIDADRAYVKKQGADNFYTLYRVHNYHFVVYGALLDGQYQVALENAREIPRQIPAEMLDRFADFIEAFLPMHYHVLVRFGRWQEILAEPMPEAERHISRSFHHYARGIALSTLGRVSEAEAEQKLFLKEKALVPSSRIQFQNSVADILDIARLMLEGEIEYRKRNHEHAFELLRDAVARDDALNYDEPWGWMQPARHALGALLLEQGHVDEATSVYREDLRRHPHNGWSLHGLAECLQKKGDVAGARKAQAEFEEAWARADVSINASCFCRIGT